jgi:hypothetical protein
VRRYDALAEVGVLLGMQGVRCRHRIECGGENTEVEGCAHGEEIEGVEGAADVEELEAGEEDDADVLWSSHLAEDL